MKYKLKKAATSIILQHIVFWVVAIALLIFPDISAGDDFSFNQILENLFILFVIVVSVYLNLLLLIPKLLRKRKYFIYVLTLIFGLSCLSFVGVYFSVEIFKTDYSKALDSKMPQLYQQLVLWVTNFILILFFVVLTTFIKLLRDWFKLQDSTLEAELKSLKAQINPHFLFNTLNNLYSLSLDSSPKTPEMILKLSDLMRYIIYECRENKVQSRKELDFIANYLSLEKLRLGDSVIVEFDVIGEPNVEIAPLLFINFIENAFKHGRKTDGSLIKVSFDFSVEQELTFCVENNIYGDSQPVNNEYSGIGIDNVKKRLHLLYPEKHKLTITSNNEKYSVQLNIQCHE
jgi:sensor histidine kinase YesM